MDPLSIASAVAGVTSACYTTAKSLHDLQGKFKDVPTTIIAISSEMTVISASLAHIQGILVQKRGLSSDIWQEENGQNDDENMRLAALDTSLTGCLVLFSCLDQEIATVNKSRSVKNGGQLSWFGRVRFLINNDRLQELLTALRGQQTAINLLIQLMQTDAISEIKRLLSENQPTLEANLHRTRTMRESLDSSSKSVPASVLERTKSIIDRGKTATGTDAYSHVAPSDLEFDFDDAIVNSRTYRRAMAAAEAAAAAKGSAETIQEEAPEEPSQSSSVYSKSRLSPPASPNEPQIGDFSAVSALAVADNKKPKQSDYRKAMDALEDGLAEWASGIPPDEPNLPAPLKTTSKAGPSTATGQQHIKPDSIFVALRKLTCSAT
ncbi:hypothetical protein V8F06_012850 [Rhypophila decipiens]